MPCLCSSQQRWSSRAECSSILFSSELIYVRREICLTAWLLLSEPRLWRNLTLYHKSNGIRKWNPIGPRLCSPAVISITMITHNFHLVWFNMLLHSIRSWTFLCQHSITKPHKNIFLQFIIGYTEDNLQFFKKDKTWTKTHTHKTKKIAANKT